MYFNSCNSRKLENKERKGWHAIDSLHQVYFCNVNLKHAIHKDIHFLRFYMMWELNSESPLRAKVHLRTK